MTKEEILEKSRNDNRHGDELDKKILSDGMKISYAAMIAAAAIFAIVRAVQGRSIMDLPAICCASVSANFIYRFLKTKEKFNLIIAVITLIIAVVTAVLFFMGH